jgi:simple sugar transport system ATP-binding protein
MLAKGIGHVPEDRNIRGLIGDFSIADNLILGYHDQSRFQKKGILQADFIKNYAGDLIKRYDIRTPDGQTPADSLSGGNQQKVVLARVFNQKPKVLVVAQPTRGVDVGATEYIHQQMLAMRDEGAAILLISADLDEIRGLSDRIGVLYRGKIVAEKQANEFTEQELGLWMAGMTDQPAVEVKQ